MQRRHRNARNRLPLVWLVSDERNDPMLEAAITGLPRGSGVIFRHYHLARSKRRARFAEIMRLAHARGHRVILSGSARQARQWGADGVYGPPRKIGTGPDLLRLATAHSLSEIGQASRWRADAIVLSPVFPTRSHPNAAVLGPVRFRLLANHAKMPVIALGGMSRSRAKRLRWRRWAAIDGLSNRAGK